MSLFTANGNGGGARTLYTNLFRHQPYTQLHHRHQLLFPLSSPRKPPFHIVSAKKLSSRTGRFDSKNRRNSNTTTDQEDDPELTAKIKRVGGGGGGGGEDISSKVENVGINNVGDGDSLVPKLPGEEPDFWEGPQWDGLGFFVQYLWAFGILFAVIASGIAVVTYNEGATDFKETPAYKESIQSQELLEEPEASNSDVFESNPTEVAPSLE